MADRNRRTRRALLAATGATFTAVAGCTGGDQSETTPSTIKEPTQEEDSKQIYIDSQAGSPNGSGTAEDPLDSIQEAFELVEPGETIRVRPGEYREFLAPPTGGEPDAPITLTGPTEAIVRPPKDFERGRPLVEIERFHVHVIGMTFTGLASADSPTDPFSYCGGIEIEPDGEGSDHLTDLTILPDRVGNFEGSMITTHRVNNVEIGEFRVIGPAGTQHLYGDEEGHFGEIVYIGGGPSVPEPEEPWDDIYRSHDIHVHHIDNSEGYPHAELVDVKAGNYDVTIEYCTDGGGSGQYILEGHDPTSETSMHLSGSTTTLRWNVIRDGNGQGVEVGAWGIAHPKKAAELGGRELSEKAFDSGQNNAIYGNRIVHNSGLAIQFRTDESGKFISKMSPDAQRVVCGNEYTGETHGEPAEPCPDWVPQSEAIGHLGGDSPWQE